MRVASITILYNFDESVLKNIETYEKFVDEVILVDNSDTNLFFEKYKDVLNKYTYISMNGNMGIAAALNKGMEYAKNKEYSWVFTLDQDSYLEDNIVEKYKQIVSENLDEDIIILSPVYIFDRRKAKKFNGYKEVKYVMQSANFLNVEKFFEVGHFKEEFFIDVVDYEYCLRAKQKGYKIISCGELSIKHNPGITKKSKILKIKYGYCSKVRIYYQARNLLWTFKEYKEFSLFCILMYKFVKILFFFDNKKEFLKYYFKGIKDCKKNKFGVID